MCVSHIFINVHLDPRLDSTVNVAVGAVAAVASSAMYTHRASSVHLIYC